MTQYVVSLTWKTIGGSQISRLDNLEEQVAKATSSSFARKFMRSLTILYYM